MTYRIALDEGGGPRRVEQHLFCDLGVELIERIDLLCSGFRPVVPPEPTGRVVEEIVNGVRTVAVA